MLTQRPEERVLVLVTSGERGLCGAFNANVLRRAFEFLNEKSGKSVEVITIAKKSRDAFRKRSWKIAGEYVDVTSRADLGKAREIAAEVMKIYEAGGADSVYLIYNEFKNVMMQTLRVEKLLPLERAALGEHEKGAPPASSGERGGLHLRAARGGNFQQAGAALRRNADLPHDRRKLRGRACRAHDGHGIGNEQCLRRDRRADAAHEQGPAGGDHARDY